MLENILKQKRCRKNNVCWNRKYDWACATSVFREFGPEDQFRTKIAYIIYIISYIIPYIVSVQNIILLQYGWFIIWLVHNTGGDKHDVAASNYKGFAQLQDKNPTY